MATKKLGIINKDISEMLSELISKFGAAKNRSIPKNEYTNDIIKSTKATRRLLDMNDSEYVAWNFNYVDLINTLSSILDDNYNIIPEKLLDTVNPEREYYTAFKNNIENLQNTFDGMTDMLVRRVEFDPTLYFINVHRNIEKVLIYDTNSIYNKMLKLLQRTLTDRIFNSSKSGFKYPIKNQDDYNTAVISGIRQILNKGKEDNVYGILFSKYNKDFINILVINAYTDGYTSKQRYAINKKFNIDVDNTSNVKETVERFILDDEEYMTNLLLKLYMKENIDFNNWQSVTRKLTSLSELTTP